MKILQLLNYPTGNPLHGGQIRCANIAVELRRKGHTVLSLGIYGDQPKPADSSQDIVFEPTSKTWPEGLFPLADYFTGVHAATDDSLFAALAEISEEFDPDLIISEHPWLFQSAQRLKYQRNRIKLVYSSHNVEIKLKESTMSRMNINQFDRRRLSKEIKEVEQNAVSQADLVIACTKMDAAYYEAEVAECDNVIVAGNGVEAFSCTTGRIEQWRNYFTKPFPVFVSSAHPPNASGFWDMMDPGLTFLKPDERVLIIGSVCDIITQMSGAQKYHALNKSRIEILGRMDKLELQAAVSASHMVLLPITEGEGSNLKTAEALESGSTIVATTKAFRGFENAMNLPHVHITDDPTTFRRTIRKLLDSDRYAGRTPEDIRSQFYWHAQLAPIITAIENIA